ncbi:MAG: NRDE family protein [Planctomycetaceae bacterium]|jgi:uncharacterized protein with NRDE domain|nr:NRDE family protein [Planctomycetaceae bacterium]
MGILAIQYQMASDSPILLVLNREEKFARPSLPPRIQSGRPRVVCGTDRKAGGTWAGVNQYGLFVAVINCPKRNIAPELRSRGILCRELLTCKTADEALDKAYGELQGGCYAGGNFFCVDQQSGGVVYGGDYLDTEKLNPGLHLLSSKRLNDANDPRQEFARRLLTLQRIDSSVAFWAIASRTFSRKADETGKRGIIITEPDYGTVSSMLLSLAERTPRSFMQYASGSPNEKSYEDISALLRQVLSTERISSARSTP